MCPEFDSRAARHMWAEFAGSLPCAEGGFPPGTPVSPFPQKPVFNLIPFDLSWLVWRPQLVLQREVSLTQIKLFIIIIIIF